MRIRGTFFKDYVELVRNTPDLSWDKYLTAADWEIVHGGIIIPTQWYPVETMGRIGRGIFEMRTGKQYKLVRLHGRSRADDSFDPGTKKFLLKDDPAAALHAYAEIAKRYIDELSVKLERSAPGLAEISFFPVDDAPSWDLFREIQAGTLERLAELNGAKNVRAVLLSEQRGGHEACIIRVTWS